MQVMALSRPHCCAATASSHLQNASSSSVETLPINTISPFPFHQPLHSSSTFWLSGKCFFRKILPAVTLVLKPSLPFHILFNKEHQVIFQRNKIGEVDRGRMWTLRSWARSLPWVGSSHGEVCSGGLHHHMHFRRPTRQRHFEGMQGSVL